MNVSSSSPNRRNQWEREGGIGFKTKLIIPTSRLPVEIPFRTKRLLVSILAWYQHRSKPFLRTKDNTRLVFTCTKMDVSSGLQDSPNARGNEDSATYYPNISLIRRADSPEDRQSVKIQIQKLEV